MKTIKPKKIASLHGIDVVAHMGVPKDEVWGVTTKWYRHDWYEFEDRPSRWMLLKWLIRGSYKLRWQVPSQKRDKTLHLEGKKKGWL